MIEYEFSEHAYDMLGERKIPEAWVKLAIEDPYKIESEEGRWYDSLHQSNSGVWAPVFASRR